MLEAIIKNDITKKQLMKIVDYLPTIIVGLIVVVALGVAMYFLIIGFMEMRN